jgi:uncharacterized metal-binding protein
MAPIEPVLMNRRDLPLVYSCSGCSSAAQLANRLALMLDRAGEAEMSCIAGVGGGVPGLVKVARSGRPILALDGCVMACAAACLKQAGVIPQRHMLLSDHGIRKLKHCEPDPEDVQRLYEQVALCEARALRKDPEREQARAP